MSRLRRAPLKLTAALLAAATALGGLSPAHADDPPTIRSQAVVNLSFDEASGDALDSAAGGGAKDNGSLQNGVSRVKSPFWGQKGGQALVLDSARKQFVQMADSPDVDRPEAVSFSMFFVNLHPAGDAAFHGVVAKRDEVKQVTNYGINYAANSDTFQVYLNDATGYKIATYGVNAAVGYRRPVYITAVYLVGDAPAPDADEDKDDVLVRFYANGQAIKPKGAVGGTVTGNDVWLTDVKVGNLLTDTPLTLGASTPVAEYASCVLDEFSLFPKALSDTEVARLFVEVAGSNASALIAEDARAVPVGPEITATSLAGLARGQTTVLTIRGTNLLPDPVVVSTAPLERQVVRPGASAERIDVELTVAATAPAGHFPLRIQTPRGISGPLTIAVDSLPELPYAESSVDKPVPIPVAISGTLAGEQQAKVYFAGKAGQRVIIDLECKRLGSAMDPVLELRNPRGAPLSIAWGRPQFRGDTRIEATLFADGVYTVELHDLAYKAPGQNLYRLKIGDLKLVDTTFPPAVASGTQRSVAAIGPGVDPSVTLAVDMQNKIAGFVQSVALPPETGAVGPAPAIVASGAIELLEESPADGKLQTIDAQFVDRPNVPIVINGRIAKHGETDRFVLNVKEGTTLNLAVDSYAIHSPLNPQIVVLSHPDGNRLALSEERPAIDLAIPTGKTAIEVAVRDLNDRGGPDFVYRLRVARAGRADFSLAFGSARLSLPRAGSAVLRLDVTRAGYDGPITLSLPDAPEFVLSPSEIPAGISKAFVVLSAKAGEPSSSLTVRHLHLAGSSVGIEPSLQRIALAPENSRLALLPGLRSELTAVVAAQPTAALVLGTLPPVWFRGADVAIPLTLTVQNPELATHTVRLALLTTEAPRTQADPADPTKQRKIPVPMLHAVPEQTLSPGETAGALRVAVPLEVVEGQIDCVVRADFISNAFSDKVLASAYSLPFRLPVQNAVSVQLAAGNLALTGNAQTRFAGTLKRTARFMGPVEVALVNLPAGYTVPKTLVAPDQEQFEIVVSAPAVAAAADIPNVQFRVSTPLGSLLQRDTAVPTKVSPGQ